MHDELALLARARALEPEALAEIHRVYYRPVYRYVAYRISDQATAEDLTSEVFTRLLSALRDQHAPQNTIRGWLFGVASRVVSDYYRRRARAPETALLESLPGGGILPEEAVDRSLAVEALRRALAELPDEQQTVLALRFGAGLKIREVAEQIGKSEGAVKQLQLRAVAALARRLGAKTKQT